MANFHNVATQHYLESSRQFHNSLVKSPALFLGSYDDSIGCIKNIQRVIEKWESRGGEVKSVFHKLFMCVLLYFYFVTSCIDLFH